MKVTLGEIFVSWFESTNQHLYKKNLKKSEIVKEAEEYVNDVLLEHIESMQKFHEGLEDWEDEGGSTKG